MNYKKGDIVVTNSGEWVMIIKESTAYDHTKVFAICSRDSLFVGCYCGWFSRLATGKEKTRLFDFLLKKGYTWDEENLELIQEL